MAEIRKDRDRFVGTHKVQLARWNPAFGLIALQFEKEDEVVEHLHVHDKVHFFLWDEINEYTQSEKKLPDEENHWEVEIEKIEHNRLGSPGPNHCGLEVVKIRQLRMKDHIKEKSKTFLDKILPWR